MVLTAPAVIVTSSIGASSHSSLTIGTLSVTHSASASAAPSGGVQVGTVVGGIIGTLVGLAVIGIVSSFILVSWFLSLLQTLLTLFDRFF